MKRILAAHQPDFIPYTGFWHKMKMADLFDVAIYDQFQKPNTAKGLGYQKRVQLGENKEWFNVSTDGSLSFKRICDVPVNPIKTIEELRSTLHRLYSKSTHYESVTEMLFGNLDQFDCRMLWQFNLAFIVRIKEMLGIQTPIGIAYPLTEFENASAAIADLCLSYGCEVYMSGAGGANYLQLEPFKAVGVRVMFSDHHAEYSQSIVHVMMKHGVIGARDFI